MKKLAVFVLVLLMSGLSLGASVTPPIAGINDTVVVSFSVMHPDTVGLMNLNLTNPSDADSIIVYRVAPDNTIDSLKNSASIVKLPGIGKYEVRYTKASNANDAVGPYRVFVTVYHNNGYRGSAETGYMVVPQSLKSYMSFMVKSTYYAGNCPGCVQTLFLRAVGSKWVTDSIQITDSLGALVSTGHFTRLNQSSTLITEIENEIK